MTLIDRYISRSIIVSTGVVALVVCAFVLVSVFIGEADNIGDGNYGLAQAVAYMILRLPSRLYLVLPVVALLGALLALGALAAGSELIVLRSSGVSMARLAGSVSIAGIVLALTTVALGELGASGVRAGDHLRDSARHGDRVDSVDDGLWLRQDNTIVRIDGTLPGGYIDGLDVYELAPGGGLELTLRAARAQLRDHQLIVDQPAITRLTTEQTRTAHPPRRALDVDIDPDVLKLAITQPTELSTPGLWRYIHYLERNDVNADNYRLALWHNVINPMTVWVLVVFALPFAFGSLRSAGAGQRLFLGGLIGLTFFLVNEIVSSIAPLYGVPPFLAAGAPTVLLVLATVIWMRRLN